MSNINSFKVYKRYMIMQMVLLVVSILCTIILKSIFGVINTLIVTAFSIRAYKKYKELKKEIEDEII